MNGFLLIIPVLFVACAKQEKLDKKIDSIAISEVFESRIHLSRIAQIDSFKIVNATGYRDLGEVKYAWPFYDGWIVHSSLPAAVSRLNQRCEVIQQVVPDFRLGAITSVAVSGREIFILDRAARKIHRYDDSLKWQEEFNLPVFAQSFTMLGSRLAVLYTGNETTEYNQGKLVMYNIEQAKVLKDLIPVSEKQRKYFSFLTTYHFPKSTGETFFWDSAINFIYAVDEEGIEPVYQIDYGTWGLPEKFYDEAEFDNAYDFVMQLRKQDYAFRHFKVLVNEECILLTFEKAGDYLTSLYSRTTGRTITFSTMTDDTQVFQRLDDIKLQFFVSFYGKNSFVGFLPVELLAIKDNAENPDAEVIAGKAVLVFGRLKHSVVQ